MKKSLSLCCLILLIFASCRHPKPRLINKLYVPSNEAEITTLVFNTIMPTDSAFKNNLPKKTFAPAETYKLQTLKNELDTSRLYIFVADTFIRLPGNYLKQQTIQRPAEEKNPLKYVILDSWAPEIIIDEKPGVFNIKNLAFTYNYSYNLRSGRKRLPKDIFSAGLFRPSAIFFNKARTKAFMYVERRGGTVTAMAYDVFLEKKKGKWFVVLSNLDWVS